MNQKQKSNQENEPKNGKYIKLAGKIIVTVLFLLYVIYSLKEIF